jgi:phosphomannomutase
MSAFKAYDFRGTFNVDFDLSDVYKIGYFLPQLLEVDRVLVGRDMRLSSPEMFQALSDGITDAGADVYDMGLCTTPMVYYFTAKHHFEASVMITASHNPKDHNGLKISKKQALPVGYDNGLKELEEMINSQKVEKKEKKGRIIHYAVKEEYLYFLSRYISDISNLNIVIDCSNGMASLLVKDIFGNQPAYINDELDGSFPNHEANPLEVKNIQQLQEWVKSNQSDIGVIYDGDADRVMFVDENAQFIQPDYMIAVLADYFLKEQKLQGKALIDIRSSKSVSEYIEQQGQEVYTWRVGRAYAALKLREIDGLFGGELAGHYYFRDFYYSDSAMVASLLLLRVLSKKKAEGLSVSQYLKTIVKYANSGEINFKIENKEKAIKELTEHFKQQENALKIMDFDGYRIEFEHWWFNIRSSNTEPYLRLIVEATTQELLNKKLEEAQRILKKYI